MFHLFLMSIVLFYVMFFALAAKYTRQNEQSHGNTKLLWTRLTH